MQKSISVLPGDGIGPEVTAQSTSVLRAIGRKFGHTFDFTYCLIGAIAIDETGSPFPAETLQECLQSDAVLFGAIGHPKYDNDPSAKVRPEQGLLKMRKDLQLFANIRPVTTYQSLLHLSPLKEKQLKNVDMVIYRELTGGIYFGEKTMDSAFNKATDLCTYTKEEITRIAELAFKAAGNRKKKVTLVDKANVLETSRLWRKVVQELALSYPDIRVEYLFVDNAAMQLILNPAQFDVILTENMFGDILSDEASVISGSLGLLPSASVGHENALFEPIHGSYPLAAGKDIANPIGSILSAAMMLDHFKLFEEAEVVRKAVDWTLSNGFVTKDIDPVNSYFTSTVGELVNEYVSNSYPDEINHKNISARKSTII